MTTKIERKVLQIMPAPVDKDGVPVFRMAHPVKYSRSSDGTAVGIQRVLAWALVRYAYLRSDGRADSTSDVVEPVCLSEESGAVEVGHTQHGDGSGCYDFVLYPYQVVTGVKENERHDGGKYYQVETDLTPDCREHPWSEGGEYFDVPDEASRPISSDLVPISSETR